MLQFLGVFDISISYQLFKIVIIFSISPSSNICLFFEFDLISVFGPDFGPNLPRRPEPIFLLFELHSSSIY